MPELSFSVFRSYNNANGETEGVGYSFDDIVEGILTPIYTGGPPASELVKAGEDFYNAEKRKLPLWSGSTFRGSRSNINFVSAWFIGFDVDGRHVEEHEVRAALAPFRGFAYTTTRSTKGAMRWRVGVLLSAPVTCASDFRATRDALAEYLQDIGAVGSKDPARQFFWPRKDPELVAFQTHGAAFPPVKAFKVQVDLSSPDARGPEHDDYVYRLGMATEHAKTCLANAPGDGGRALFVASQVLVRKYELPLETARTLLREHFNPRCLDWDGQAYPWEEEDLERKLEQARDCGEFPIGCVGEDMLDPSAVGREAAHRPTPAIPTHRRLCKNPQHSYKCQLGDVANGEKDKKSLADVVCLLVSHPDWMGVLQHDEFSDKILAVDPPISLNAEGGTGLTDTDAVNIRYQLEVCHDSLVSKEQAWDAAISAASKHTFHPVKDYLRSLPAGDPRALDGLAAKLFGAVDHIEEVYLRKFLVAAVRRVFKPGTKVDSALVLYEPQGGKQKSTFVSVLFGAWTTSLKVKSLGDTEVARKLQGNWCLEMGEMGAIARSDLEVVKDFMSCTEDFYRAPYGRTYQRRGRQCVFIGTTNTQGFIKDEAHARRFWPITVRHAVDLEYLRAHRDEIWAAAMAIAFSSDAWLYDELHWLAADERLLAVEGSKEYQDQDAWYPRIEEYCAGKGLVKTERIFADCFAGQAGDGGFDNAKRDRIVAVLKHLGCTNASKWDKVLKKHQNGWVTPNELAEREPSQQAFVPPERRPN